MELLVHIPQKGTEYFSVFGRGKITDSSVTENNGTYIIFDGVVIVFYKYPRHRRAYMIRNAHLVQHCPKIRLPYIKQPVGLIYRVYGRKIDILRNVLWNLEKMRGTEVYEYETKFWQEISCLLDTYNGRKSKAFKSNLLLLIKKYKR